MFRTNAGKRKLCAWVLLVVLLVSTLGEASAAITGVSAESISKKKLNIYVRAFVPGSNTPWNP